MKIDLFATTLFIFTILQSINAQPLYSGLGDHSLYFNYSSWIQFPVELSQEIGREFTFECWFQVGPVADTRNNPNPGDWGSSVPGYSALNRPIVSRWRSDMFRPDNAFNDFDLQINPEGLLQFFLGGSFEERNLGVFVEATNPMESNRWYHVAVSVLYSPDASDEQPQSALLILDYDWDNAHVLDFQFANWRTLGGEPPSIAAVRNYLPNETIYVGRYQNNDIFWPNGQYFVGGIDEIRFWRGIRLETEVGLYLNRSIGGYEPWLNVPGLPGKPGAYPAEPNSRATLIAAYNLNEGTGDIAHDQGPFGFHANITNPMWRDSEVYIIQYYYLLMGNIVPINIPLVATGGSPNPDYNFTISFIQNELQGNLTHSGSLLSTGDILVGAARSLEVVYTFTGNQSGLYKFFYLVEDGTQTAWLGRVDRRTEVRIIVDTCDDFGDKIDVCGICNGNNLTADCFGICNGTAVLDDCGVCNGTNTTCIGCDGVFKSGLQYDVCGICGGNGTTCLGCDGIPFSNATVDFCGVCGGNNATLDSCGVCNGTNSTCFGCDGVPFSNKTYDLCGVCDGNNACLGCDDVPFSGKVYDVCGICGGDNSTCGGCDGEGGQYDACGVCAGDNSTCQCVVYNGFSIHDLNYLLFSYSVDQIAFKVGHIEDLLLLILEDLQYYSGPGDFGVIIKYLNQFCAECFDNYNRFLDEFIASLKERQQSLPPGSFIPVVYNSTIEF